MKLKSLLFGSAAALMVVGGAQAADLPVAAEPVDYVRVCDAFGNGFFYIPGTETCLRVSGRVRVEAHFVDSRTRNSVGELRTDRRAFNNFTTRARGYVRLDSRTQSDIGLVRAYVSMHMTVGPSDFDENYSGTTSTLEEAFISIQGDRGTFTAGHTGSQFNFFGSNTFGVRVGIDDPQTEATQFSYRFSGANGFYATLSVEDPASAGRRASSDNGDDGIHGGQRYPDLVGNIGITQGWGAAQVMGALHHVRSDVGNVDSELGYAVGAGLRLTIPNTALEFATQGTYSRGAVAYATGGMGNDISDGNPGFNGDDNGFFDNDLSEAWNVRAGLNATLTETVSSSLDGSYTSYDQEGTGTTDFDVWAVAGNVRWVPVAGLTFGAELAYRNYEFQEARRTFDDDQWGGMVRVQRDF